MVMLEKFKKDIDTGLNSILKEAVPDFSLRTIPLLYQGIQDFITRPGKRIRPILFLISYHGYTKRREFSYDKLVKSSLSLELLHDFLLIHDDIIDNSNLRRGRPTLHRLFNSKIGSLKNRLCENLSIVAGDVLFSLAVKALLLSDEDISRKERAVIKFTETALLTGMGEFIDVLNDTKKIEQIKEKDVLLTNTLKTTKYTFEGPLLIGALLAGAKKHEITKLSKMSHLLGQAFQLRDDLLDIFSSSKKIGKPILSDLNESKKTLLVWRTFQRLSKKDKKQFARLLEKNKKTYKDLLALRELIKITGADEYCRQKIQSLIVEADEICSRLNMSQKYKTSLKQLIQKL
ncbi:MAG: polyprenyl synthetase family protein [Candidatus Omnitrophota bacterium]